MSLSLDYITMPPKSQEVSQIQTQEITRMEQENQQLATQYQAEIKHHSEQTIRRNKAENEELKNDEKKKQQKNFSVIFNLHLKYNCIVCIILTESSITPFLILTALENSK